MQIVGFVLLGLALAGGITALVLEWWRRNRRHRDWHRVTGKIRHISSRKETRRRDGRTRTVVFREATVEYPTPSGTEIWVSPGRAGGPELVEGADYPLKINPTNPSDVRADETDQGPIMMVVGIGILSVVASVFGLVLSIVG
ncbi:DUF3592 domain-containing protein [Parenemella sanctibonifatiensis]|uniref:DUF3592 domain-containing protein n=1 Tax=Parenemella sanctibonifatiensis TaxID=2016505 RepID=A0A255DXJ7_9ACTN|nr:DUF3592 domain-containing protein [Parenemella sanctibonifatiensis]OYN83984.1 hypothetical protein CGZ92_13045 [Parenemella sanctibonifatiensis]